MSKTGRLPKEFLRLNVNPNGNEVNDCVVRAIAYASGKTWHEVFDLLCETAGKMAMMPNYKDVYAVVLESLGFVKQTIATPKKGGKRKCVRDLAKQCPKLAVVKAAHHLVAIDGQGHYVDIWDCGNKTAYTYWTLG
jgi:hypothetical protein